MRLLADQNIPRHTVDALRSEGHDVVWIQTADPGADDEVLLRKATAEERTILTFDKDFGELAFRTRLPTSCGVILLRFTPSAPTTVTDLVIRALRSRHEWTGRFTVVEETRIRTRPLPSDD
ncbi:MAG: hypothetical protein GVY35_15825 [Bacteroidetes bacterium]|nr:hypothetical protein [Bacteroidota bacterium]